MESTRIALGVQSKGGVIEIVYNTTISASKEILNLFFTSCCILSITCNTSSPVASPAFIRTTGRLLSMRTLLNVFPDQLVFFISQHADIFTELLSCSNHSTSGYMSLSVRKDAEGNMGHLKKHPQFPILSGLCNVRVLM